MSTTDMPATEAAVDLDEQELASYELAYHVLPTVAEGEVSDVRDRIAAAITGAGGTLGEEETPQRIDLAYEIIKPVEGKNRRFTSAYFGWVRFTAVPNIVDSIAENVTADKAVLRHLLIRLTKTEELEPFYLHEALAAERTITNVDAEEVPADIDPNADADTTADTDDIAEDTSVASTGTDTDVDDVAADATTADDASTTDKAA